MRTVPVEFDAFIGPSALDLHGRTVAWMDAVGARRVFYVLNSAEELAKGGLDRLAEASAQSAEEPRSR